ncbi:MAG: UDP-N-acetylmuramoyl-L-alanine--D-glutamate ligase [Chitinophagaceae bacterium]
MKKLIILGAGESGTGAALLGHQKGYDVFVSDGGRIPEPFKTELKNQNIPYEEGSHSLDKVLNGEEIVKSPGINENTEIMKKIRDRNIPVISEIEFAYRYSKDKNIIGITGSNGKSTTTSLIYHMLKTAGLQAACVGNIGYSYARQVAMDPVDHYVVEVSSFQLDDTHLFRPHIAVLLNITPDHLDRYQYQMENYAKSKFRIVLNQTDKDYFIFCQDDKVISEHLDNQPIHSKKLPFSIMEPIKEGGFVENGNMNIHVNGEYFAMSIYDLALKGKHNQYNSMAAGISGRTMDIRKEKIRESLTSFNGLEHRLEFVATVRGIDFINDSKATNVNSVWFALESMEKPVILILGGIDKGNDYSLILALVKEKVKAIVCLGTDNRKIHEAFGKEVELIVNTHGAREAVHAAYHFAEKGDVVLLSPGCASFDLFKNYEDRGRQFKEAVKEL